MAEKIVRTVSEASKQVVVDESYYLLRGEQDDEDGVILPG
jgi:hypothetical protein